MQAMMAHLGQFVERRQAEHGALATAARLRVTVDAALDAIVTIESTAASAT